MKEFIDKDHDVIYEYFDLSDLELSSTKKIKALIKIIKTDAYFFDPYISLAETFEEQGLKVKSNSIINEGFKKCMDLILDKKGKWPDKLEWGWIENRHVIRIILNKGIKDWNIGKVDDALFLFKMLLKVNPNDNVGAREFVLAIKMNMTFDDYENKFNKGGYYGTESWEWFDKNYKKFPEEFSAWSELMEEHQ